MTGRIYDVAILGAGPGGYVAAIRAAQLGLSVCVVEKSTPGGVCLNWGCIPSKSLIHTASEFQALKAMEAIGVKVDRSGLDYGKVHAASRQAANALAKGVASLLEKNKVTIVKGKGRIDSPGRIVTEEGAVINAKALIIATGSRPAEIPGFTFDEKRVLSSSGLLAAQTLPRSLVILGAGAIGCEFAYVMNAFGCRVTLVELAPHLLPSEDAEAARIVETAFKKSGIVIHTSALALGWSASKEGVAVTIETKDGQKTVEAEQVLAAFGRKPNTEGIGLEKVGVRLDAKGFVETGDFGQTSVTGLYAIGDVTTTPLLAHVASKEGEIVVEHLAGHACPRRIDPELVPSAVYCEPQVAGFGLREGQAVAQGLKVSKSVFPFRAIGKSVAVGKTDGFVKVLADPATGEILGGHVVGGSATELIHLLLLAKASEVTADEVGSMIFAHPTLAEAVMEASRGVMGSAIHI